MESQPTPYLTPDAEMILKLIWNAPEPIGAAEIMKQLPVPMSLMMVKYHLTSLIKKKAVFIWHSHLYEPKLYLPVIKITKYKRDMLKEIANKNFGSVKDLVGFLIRHKELTQPDMQELVELSNQIYSGENASVN